MTDRPDRAGRPERLGEALREAREARGLDLAAVERDTRIRERFLSALERSAFEELPGPVYTRGFLRNYATYLALDADALVDRYRSETASGQRVPARTPIRQRRSAVHNAPRFLLTRSTVTAALLTLMVGAIVAYLAYEIVTFARTPELRILEPAGDVVGHTARTIQIRGVTEPNARVMVEGLRENPRVIAGPDGGFMVTVELVPGSNVVSLSAFDPVTRRTSPTVQRMIEVTGDGSGGVLDGGESESAGTPSVQAGARRGRWQQTLPSTW